MKLRIKSSFICLAFALIAADASAKTAINESNDKPFKKVVLATPKEVKFSKAFTIEEKSQVKEFVQTEGQKVLDAGWKYYTTNTVVSSDSLSVTVIVTGTQALVADWSQCSQTYWGAPPSSNGPLAIATEAKCAEYEGQGYWCVCASPQRVVEVWVDGWVGWQLCVTVTATMELEACPCLL